MASRTSTTALQAAMKGDRVTDRQARSALGAAVDKIANLSRRADKSKDAMLATGTQVVHTAETHGSLFLSSMAEGYLGPDRLKVGNVDVRAPVGLLAAGYGLYETMSGRKGGGHALAIGNGVLGSWLASVGQQAGQTLAERRGTRTAGDVPALPSPVTLTPSAVQGLMPEPDLSLQGPMREVLLTPEASDDDDFEGPRRRRRRRPRRARRRRGPRQGPRGPSPGAGSSRFVRAQRRHAPAAMADDDPEALDTYLLEEPD